MGSASHQESGEASAVKTHLMPVRVVVREGESVKTAFARLGRLVQLKTGRPSHKHRYGYYEKPSELTRKRERKEKIVRRRGQFFGMPCVLVLRVCPHSALFARTGPSNALGH